MADKDHRIQKALDRSFLSGKRIPIDAEGLNWVIFSDHHRGRKDGADDFLICEETYLKALEFYKEKDSNLCLLGDVEEFWENPPITVIAQYREVLQKEKEFYDSGKLHRIWGNHDDDWRVAGQISKHLGWLFPKIQVHESLILEMSKGNKCRDILLIHGHQGTLNSDRFSWLSRLFVRFIWRNFQRLFKVALSTPANNIKLKSEHDQAMYSWADRNDRVLICGHTHHPVFMSYTHADKLKQELQEMKLEVGTEPSEEFSLAMNSLKEKIRIIEMDEGASLDVMLPKPFYFNSGCCSYSDGDITGLELSDGEIRLIKWTGAEKERKVLGSTKLDFLLDYC